MPIYPYRCESKHYTEKFFSMGKQEKEVACACGKTAKRVFTVPHMWVDNTDKTDYTISAGRNFSNRRELEAWMKANNVHVADDAEWSADREHLEERKDFAQSLAAKGIDYKEYLDDQRYLEQKHQDEEMRRLGVKVEQVNPDEYFNATAEQGWVDTVESDYTGETYTNDVGQQITRVSTPERVECPYSELTNGEVSNV
jgi:hypothetical protein